MRALLISAAAICLAVLLSSSTSSAQETESAGPAEDAVLVLPLAFEGVEEAVARQVEEAVTVALGKIEGLRVLSRAEVELIVAQERQRDLLGCDEAAVACMAELAQATAAGRAVGGRVGKVADSFVITLSLSDTAHAAVLGRASEVAYDAAGLLDAAGRAALTLFGRGQAEGPRFRLADSQMKSLALLNLTPMGIKAQVAQNLTQVIAVRLKQVEGLEVITWDDVKAILAVERLRDLADCQDDIACMAEIGGAMGADGLIAGHLGRLGDTYVIGLKLIDPRGVRVVTRITESFRGDVNQIIRAARYAVSELMSLPRSGQGRLEIESEADEGQVLLGEDEAQPLAAFSAELPEGKYLLRIETEDYLPWASDVYVERSSLTRLDAALTPRPSEWYETWWFWTATLAVVAGAGATTAGVLLTREKSDPDAPGAMQGGGISFGSGTLLGRVP